MTLLRKCVSCGKKNDKFSMIRINKSPDKFMQKKIVVLDVGNMIHVDGRCAYVCCNLNCLKKAKKSSRIEKSFKCKIDSSIYDTIEKMISANSVENARRKIG